MDPAEPPIDPPASPPEAAPAPDPAAPGAPPPAPRWSLTERALLVTTALCAALATSQLVGLLRRS